MNYSFQPRFVEPIRSGTKGGTIRAPRKIPERWSAYARARRPGGHAIAGEFLDLYCRQRQPSGFFICQQRCFAVERIALDFIADVVAFPTDFIERPDDLDAFARFDGFADWADLASFWRTTHGVPQFEGWHIRWKGLPS